MENLSPQELVRQTEGFGEEIALDEKSRLDRRRFLKSSALTVAGVATLSGVELIRAPLALAQQPAAILPGVQNFQLLSAGSSLIGNGPLHVCRHAYRFDYTLGQSLPPELVQTFRLNLGSAFAGGTGLADRLQPIMQPAPFQNPQLAPAGFPPAPDQTPPFGSPLPQQLLSFVCYRLAQLLQTQTFPPQTIVRVHDYCSLYCYPGDIIVIAAGDKCVCYRVGAVGGTTPPPPPQQTNIVDDTPQLSGPWGGIRSGTQHSVGGIYYYTYSSQSSATATAVWAAQLNVPQGTQLRVDAFIPGSSQPQNRTASARYQIFNAGFISGNVAIDQRRGTSGWVTLGTFPFRPGTFEVHLTNHTGEATNSRIVVADAVRWVG